MMLNRVMFHKAMSAIKAEDKGQQELYDKLDNTLINTDRLCEYLSIDPMIELVASLCGCKVDWLCLYIYDLNWGSDNGCAVAGNRKLPMKTFDDLYEVITYSKPWELQFRIN